ncbi:MAG: thioredoxin domain-containing protein [Patescibacteria group bacterium]|nr:thioredoxin domain-containing protein [Patescibacteria group bacterium]
MEPQTHSHGPSLSVPAAIIIAGAIIGGSLIIGLRSANVGNVGSGTAAPVGAAAPAAKAVNVKNVKITASDPYIGKANAPVTLAYWSDYQCPFCKAVEVGGVPQITVSASIPTLIKNYVDTGKLRIVFKDYPFLGNDSITAALYEHAVWEKYPSLFYTWREAMFKAQDQEGDVGFGNEASILKLIATIPGMDANALKALVAENKDRYTTEMNADKDEGTSLGVQGTPAFITGTVFIDGAQPLSSFTSAIDAQLK